MLYMRVRFVATTNLGDPLIVSQLLIFGLHISLPGRQILHEALEVVSILPHLHLQLE